MVESDFDAIFGDDYLYFFSDRLSDQRSDSEVGTITALLGLKAGDLVADVALAAPSFYALPAPHLHPSTTSAPR
jgi:hypothetical protein